MPEAQQDLGSFYSELFSNDFFVFDQNEPYFQEKLVQILWNEQLLNKETTVADGRTLEVIHPGVWNLESGPDFHDAAIFLDGQARRGSIEIHLRSADWYSHNHHQDAAYANVILHVVWENRSDRLQLPEGVPMLVLKDSISTSIDELMDRFNPASYPYGKQVQPLSWAERFASMSDEQLSDLLQSYGVARILNKARHVGKLIQEFGLDQTVYQLLCDAMGYKSNRRAFAELCSLLPLSDFSDKDPQVAMGLLFGAAGLLPDPSRTALLPEYSDFVKQLWSLWWSRRREYREIKWNRRSRPFNVPERRLLGVSLLLERCDLRPGSRIIETFLEADSGKDAVKQLRKTLTIDDKQWADFYTFAKRLDKGGALVGKSRVDDILVNVAIPVFFAWCFLHNSPQDCIKGRAALLNMPKLQSNRLFKEAIGHFFVPPSRGNEIVANACAQQGLLKLSSDFFDGPLSVA